VYNFAGLVFRNLGDNESALKFFMEAYKLNSDEADICINLSETLADLGEYGKAETLLLTLASGSAPVYNQLGNIYARRRQYKNAAKQYEMALGLDPKNPIYLENAAGVFIEVDELTRAEELLRKGLEIEPSSSLYKLMGYIAVKLGEYSRAEKSYEAGLALDPGNSFIRLDLAELWFSLGRYEGAKKLLEEGPHLNENPQPQADKNPAIKALLDKIRDQLESAFFCGLCGMEWRVPKEVPEQGQLLVKGELSDASPAGECPECGAVYCVGCAKEYLDDGRFLCPKCGVRLKLGGDQIKYIVAKYLE
jgi:tetratricopeptide (TPR) repeat protein